MTIYVYFPRSDGVSGGGDGRCERTRIDHGAGDEERPRKPRRRRHGGGSLRAGGCGASIQRCVAKCSRCIRTPAGGRGRRVATGEALRSLRPEVGLTVGCPSRVASSALFARAVRVASKNHRTVASGGRERASAGSRNRASARRDFRRLAHPRSRDGRAGRKPLPHPQPAPRRRALSAAARYPCAPIASRPTRRRSASQPSDSP